MQAEPERQHKQASTSGRKIFPATALQLHRPVSRIRHQAYVGLADDEAAALLDVRTGAHVVAFYDRFGPSSAVKFFHCNRAVQGLQFRPYDLVVADKKRLDPQEHFIISAAGVTCILDGIRSDYTHLADWDRERRAYDAICCLGFFRTFIAGRSFRRWRGVGISAPGVLQACCEGMNRKFVSS